MPYEKFDVSQLERLNDPARLEYLVPEVIWQAANVEDPETIIDVGAGTGLFACRFAELAPRATVFAADVEPTMVRWMIEHRSADLGGRLKPVLAQESTIPLPTGEADLVVMINLHHELADPIASYREALRLLRIGGRIAVADWSPHYAAGGPPLHIRASAEQIVAALEKVGFADAEIHPGLERHSLVTGTKPVVCAL